MGSYIIENAEIRHIEGTAVVLFCSKSKNKVREEFSSIENAEMSYCWVLILLKMLK